MAHVKGSGKVSQQSQQKRHGKHLGLKMAGGQKIKTGQIILRQRGLRYKPGRNVGVGRDHTLFAETDGKVEFYQRHGKTMVKVVTA